MPNDKETPLLVAGEGLLSGMSAALALTAMIAVGRKAMGHQEEPNRMGNDAEFTAGEALAEEPSIPPAMSEITATFVQKVATGIFGTSLSREQQYVAGVAWHLTYGGFWGVLYALIKSSVRVPDLLIGPLYGIGVWAFGPGWLVPKMKIMLPPAEQKPRTAAMVIGGHAAYGAITAAVLHLLRRKR
jgi:hypothetical protein